MSVPDTGDLAPGVALYKLLERLIAFDTTSRNSNLELIAWVKDYLSGFGIESLLVHDETGSKANLYATVGPEDRSGVMLSGHTDVVPVDGQDCLRTLLLWLPMPAPSMVGEPQI